MKTFITWQGNKTRYVKYILPYLPENINTFIEPFIGSGALFLHVQPDKWIINDKNKDLINVWKTVQKDKTFLINKFKKFKDRFITLSNDDKIKVCKKIMEKMKNLNFDKTRASSYLLLKYCAYMGHITKHGEFLFQGLNPNIFLRNEFYFMTEKYYTLIKSISTYLNNTEGKIFNTDYKKIIAKANEGDFIYLDPPYFEYKKQYVSYNKDEIPDENFIDELYQQVKILDKKNAYWVMSQANNTYIVNKFKNYKIKKIRVHRNGSNSYKYELLIFSKNL